MPDDENSDDGISWAEHIFGRMAVGPGRDPQEPNANAVMEPAPATATQDNPVSEGPPPEAPDATPSEGAIQQRELKTADELARMIETDLARHPDCPAAGFRVTVYGWPHWRAMLTIAPAAGAVHHPQEWRNLTNDLADRLRKRYDLAL